MRSKIESGATGCLFYVQYKPVRFGEAPGKKLMIVFFSDQPLVAALAHYAGAELY